jgi:hypothetical protein
MRNFQLVLAFADRNRLRLEHGNGGLLEIKPAVTRHAGNYSKYRTAGHVSRFALTRTQTFNLPAQVVISGTAEPLHRSLVIGQKMLQF